MKKSATVVALAAMAVLLIPSAYAETDAPAAAVKVESGAMLYSSAGNRIGSVHRVTAEGNPQVILDGRLVPRHRDYDGLSQRRMGSASGATNS